MKFLKAVLAILALSSPAWAEGFFGASVRWYGALEAKLFLEYPIFRLGPFQVSTGLAYRYPHEPIWGYAYTLWEYFSEDASWSLELGSGRPEGFVFGLTYIKKF